MERPGEFQLFNGVPGEKSEKQTEIEIARMELVIKSLWDQIVGIQDFIISECQKDGA